MEDILEERTDLGLRVRIAGDPYPYPPDDEYMAPVLRLSTGARPVHLHPLKGSLGPRDDEAVENAARRWGTPSSGTWKYMEKFLRSYLGATRVDTYFSGSYWYVSYDSENWRQKTGRDLNAALVPEADLLAEWKAWAEGEVYQYIVEQRVPWKRIDGVLDAELGTWEEVEGCGGYYGYEWAKEAAMDAFTGECEYREARQARGAQAEEQDTSVLATTAFLGKKVVHVPCGEIITRIGDGMTLSLLTQVVVSHQCRQEAT